MKLLLGVLCTLLLAGCGGGGGGGANALPSAFAGTYLGSWENKSISHYGSASLVIDTSGSASGTAHNTILDTDGSLSGRISDDGFFNGLSQYPGEQATSMIGTLTLANGHLTGTLQQNVSGTVYNIDLDLLVR